MTSKCCGWVCDHQRVVELKSDNDKTCGCFALNPGTRSNLVFIHRLKFMDIEGNFLFHVNNFSSKKFSNTYLTGELHCRLHESMITDDILDDITDACDNVLEAINLDQGFMVLGWYKKGMITDKSDITEGQNVKVDSGKVTYHVTTITAYNKKVAKKKRYNVNHLNCC